MMIAMIQMAVSKDKSENLHQAAKYITRAAQLGADLAVLPEMFCCPYQTQRFPQYAEAKGGIGWTVMSQCAAGNNIWLVAGTMPEIEKGNVYNTAYIFDNTGKQVARHRKIHLFDINIKDGQHFRESDTLTAGDTATIFDTPFCKIGVAICYDIRFPELSRLMALRGAKALIYPGAFNMTTGPAHWELHLRGRAVDNQVFTLGVAPARDENAPYISYANSMAVSPWGDVLTRMGTEAGIALCHLDMNRLDQVREQLPLLRQRREAVYTMPGYEQIPVV